MIQVCKYLRVEFVLVNKHQTDSDYGRDYVSEDDVIDRSNDGQHLEYSLVGSPGT